MTKEGNDWFELREFAGTSLLESFVLSWDYSAEALTIDLDLCLTPDHPFYEKPRPSEGVCIRPATLEFPYCTAVKRQSTTQAGSDPASVATTLVHGRIEDLRRVADGQYLVEGRFGQISITSERPILRLKSTGA